MLKKERRYIYVYQTVNQVNGKTYIGVHSTDNLDDGYIGCGIYKQAMAKKTHPFHAAVRKYGYPSFRKYILSFYDNYNDALEEEAFIVNKEWVKSDDNYNVALGGNKFPFAHIERNELLKKYKEWGVKRIGKQAAVNKRSVIQYSISGEVIKKYESAQEAQRIFSPKSTSTISACCWGLTSQAHGYVFRWERYTSDEMETLNKNLSKRKRVYNSDGSWTYTEDECKIRGDRFGDRRGRIVSHETRTKQSLAKIGRKLKPHTQETKDKIGIANKIAHLKKKGVIQ